MKAFLCREFGPISSHKVEEIDDLIPGSHDIVINVVLASGVLYNTQIAQEGENQRFRCVSEFFPDRSPHGSVSCLQFLGLVLLVL